MMTETDDNRQGERGMTLLAVMAVDKSWWPKLILQATILALDIANGSRPDGMHAASSETLRKKQRRMPEHNPRRGDPIEKWLKEARDRFERSKDYSDMAYYAYTTLDDLLDEYRFMADCGDSLWTETVATTKLRITTDPVGDDEIGYNK